MVNTGTDYGTTKRILSSPWDVKWAPVETEQAVYSAQFGQMAPSRLRLLALFGSIVAFLSFSRLSDAFVEGEGHSIGIPPQTVRWHGQDTMEQTVEKSQALPQPQVLATPAAPDLHNTTVEQPIKSQAWLSEDVGHSEAPGVQEIKDPVVMLQPIKSQAWLSEDVGHSEAPGVQEIKDPVHHDRKDTVVVHRAETRTFDPWISNHADIGDRADNTNDIPAEERVLPLAETPECPEIATQGDCLQVKDTFMLVDTNHNNLAEPEEILQHIREEFYDPKEVEQVGMTADEAERNAQRDAAYFQEEYDLNKDGFLDFREYLGNYVSIGPALSRGLMPHSAV